MLRLFITPFFTHGIRYYLHVVWLSVSLTSVVCMLVLATYDWPQFSTPKYSQEAGFDNLLGLKLSRSTNVHRKEFAVSREEMNSTHIWGIPMEPVDVKYENNIFFSVKTTDAYFITRLLLLMLTWFQVVNKDKVRIPTIVCKHMYIYRLVLTLNQPPIPNLFLLKKKIILIPDHLV